MQICMPCGVYVAMDVMVMVGSHAPIGLGKSARREVHILPEETMYCISRRIVVHRYYMSKAYLSGLRCLLALIVKQRN